MKKPRPPAFERQPAELTPAPARRTVIVGAIVTTNTRVIKIAVDGEVPPAEWGKLLSQEAAAGRGEVISASENVVYAPYGGLGPA